MQQDYKFYGWKASYFAGKTRGYLNYKGVDYIDKEINLFDMLVKIPKHTGRQAMPAIKCKSGEWFCDTPLIMEEFEKRHPEPSIHTKGPIQTFVAELFQNWMDDMGIPMALHTRWSYPENYEKVNREEGGKNLLPFAPQFIRNKLADKVFHGSMTSAMPRMGVVPEQTELLESWSLNILDLLEAHLSQHDYLLGGRPTVADYALLGLMNGHLNRDPWPKREWIDPRPNLQKWVEKTHSGETATGDLLADDQIPASFMPIVKIILDEYLPMMALTVKELKSIIENEQLKSGDPLPRSTAKISFKMGSGSYKRGMFSYSVWRMQRLQKIVQAYSQNEKQSLNAWLGEQNQQDFLTLDFGCALKRHGLMAALA